MCQNPQDTVNLVTFTDEILNGKLHFLCKEMPLFQYQKLFLLNVNWKVLHIKSTFENNSVVKYLMVICSYVLPSTKNLKILF